MNILQLRFKLKIKEHKTYSLKKIYSNISNKDKFQPVTNLQLVNFHSIKK
jgi:hypothetical protein